MKNKLITNPLKKRRVMLGLTQMEVSSQLGITQSQYSRLEKSESDPTKYLVRLAKIFDVEPQDLFGTSTLSEIEQDPLNLPKADEVGFTYHERKPNEVFLDLKKGWYRITEIKDLPISIKESQPSFSTKKPKPIIRPKKRHVLRQT